MGGQQFCTRGLLVDLTDLNRIVDLDVERGLVTVEAGIQWPELVAHLAWAGAAQAGTWGIVQKQTGADRMTIGGALAANIHGRGLRFKPIVQDVEEFQIVDPRGALVRCSRTRNPDLFAVAIGGYGLFGPMATITLRLARRHKIERRVAIGRVDDLPELFDRRLRTGTSTATSSSPPIRTRASSCRRGCCRATARSTRTRVIPEDQHQLSERDWRRLFLLAHTNKSRAFAEYARHYMSSDGQVYWSDTHQLADYQEDYHDGLDCQLAAPVKGSEMISELYVPRAAPPGIHGCGS